MASQARGGTRSRGLLPLPSGGGGRPRPARRPSAEGRGLPQRRRLTRMTRRQSGRSPAAWPSGPPRPARPAPGPPRAASRAPLSDCGGRSRGALSLPARSLERRFAPHTPAFLPAPRLPSAALRPAADRTPAAGHGTRTGTLLQRPGLRGRRDGQAQERGAHHRHHGPGECGGGGAPAWARVLSLRAAPRGLRCLQEQPSASRKGSAAGRWDGRCGAVSVLCVGCAGCIECLWSSPGGCERVCRAGCRPHTGAGPPARTCPSGDRSVSSSKPISCFAAAGAGRGKELVINELAGEVFLMYLGSRGAYLLMFGKQEKGCFAGFVPCHRLSR